MARKKRAKFAFVSFAIVFGIVIALGLAEVFIRVFDLSPLLHRVSGLSLRLSNNPRVKYENVPYGCEGVEAVNGEGRREPNRPAKSDEKVFRIGVFGDSVTYGRSVPMWETYCQRLEYLLNHYKRREDVRFEVRNYGVPGYSIREDVAMAQEKVIDDKWGLIILGYCLNDPDPVSPDLKVLFKKFEWKDEAFFSILQNAWESKLRRFVYRNFKLYPFIKYRYLAAKQKRLDLKATGKQVDRFKKIQHENIISNKSQTYEEYVSYIYGKYWNETKSSLCELKKIAAGNDVESVIVVFPLLLALERYTLSQVHEDIAKMTKECDMERFDALNIFQDYFAAHPGIIFAAMGGKDPIHPNIIGHRLIAWFLAEKLIETKKIPFEKSDFKNELFKEDFAMADAPQKYLESQGMFLVERGLMDVKKKNFGAACRNFDLALQLEPDNPIAQKAYAKCRESSR